MRNTYRNDGNISTYPFSAAEALPFPLSCIQQLDITLYGEYAGYVSDSLVVSSVELYGDTVKATLSLSTGGTRICTMDALACSRGGSAYGSLDTTVDDVPVSISYSALLLAGIVPPDCYGTYEGAWKLDSSCIHICGFSGISRVSTDGVAHKVSGVLTLESTGLLESSVFTDSGKCHVFIRGRAPDGVVTTIQDVSRETGYQLVESINGISTMSSTLSKKLHIVIDRPIGSKTDTDTATYITTKTDNAIPMSSIDTDIDKQDPDETATTGGQRSTCWAGLTDTYGGATIVTLCGSGKIRNCYGSDDDAMSEYDEIEEL